MKDRSRSGAQAHSVGAESLAGALGAVITGLLPLEPRDWPVGISVLVAVGGTAGAALGVLRRGLLDAPGRVQGLVWLLVSGAVALGSVLRAGTLGRIEGSHRTLALLALGAGLAGTVALSGVLLAVQPGPGGAPLSRAPTRLRHAILATLAVVGLVLSIVEFAVPILAGYPSLQAALRFTAWLLAMTACRPLVASVPRAGGTATTLVFSALAGALLARADAVGRLATAGPSALAIELLWAASDVDGDGAPSLFGATDCAPFDPSIHPGAREIPGNGRDDNCQYGDARPRRPAEARPIHVPAGVPPVDLVLITIDALRADHTSMYGHSRDTTPNLARLAREGLVFDQAMTTGGWTALALPTLLRGRQARTVEWVTETRRVRDTRADETRGPVYVDYVAPRPAAAERSTVASALAARGYKTVAALSGGLELLADGVRGGFDRLVVAAVQRDTAVTELAVAELTALRADEPFFLWVHYFDPHDPFERHEGVPLYGKALADGYDHEIRSTDEEVGRLLGELSRRSVRPRLVVVASDHGETLSEQIRWQWHGADTCDESIRIPLVVAGPGVRAGRSATPASLVDVAPTLLAAAGAELPPWLDGHDLRTLPEGRAVITDLWRHDSNERVFLDHIVVTGARQRVVRDRLKGFTTLHDATPGSCPPPALPGEPEAGLLEALGAYEERATSGPR